MEHAAHTLRSRMTAGIDWFIPAQVRGGDPDALRQARLVVAFTWTLFAAAVIYTSIHYLMNSSVCAVTLVAGAGMAVPILYVMHRTGSSLIAGNMIAAAFFGVLTIMASRLGGHGSIVLPWYVGVPVVALSTAGRRSAFCWLAVTALSLAAFYAIDCAGYTFPCDLTHGHYELFGLLMWLGLILLMLVLALLFEAAKVQMLRQVRDSEHKLELERRQLLSMFDNMDEVIYVADPQTYELLYMNGPARKEWGDHVGEPCYQVLQNRDTPCPFCTNDRIFGAGAGTYVWEFQNPTNQRHYRCMDRAIRWSDGRLVRFEFAVDISDRKEHEALLKQAKETAEAHANRAAAAMADMERVNAVMMGREERVLAIKQEVNELLVELGRPSRYEHV